uniref:LRRCT domain-containing protein n=1 Tax=Romanomermis culicivorax TaxID=13658 RepID=A0A915KFC6_ROMCU
MAIRRQCKLVLCKVYSAVNESACLPDGKYCPAGCQCKVDRDGKTTDTLQVYKADNTLHQTVNCKAVGNNPLQCDCEMEWFSEWIKKDFLEPGVARCTGPEPLRGQLLLTTPSDQFKCSSTGGESSRPGFFHLFSYCKVTV